MGLPRSGLVTQRSQVTAHLSLPGTGGDFGPLMVCQACVLPGSYPGSLPRDRLSQQQRERKRDALKACLWLFQLEIVTHGPLPLLLTPHPSQSDHTSTFLPFSRTSPHPMFPQMAASLLAFLQGNGKTLQGSESPSPSSRGDSDHRMARRGSVQSSSQGSVKCCSSFQVGYDTKAKTVQAQPRNSRARETEGSRRLGTAPPPLGPAGGTALLRAVLVTQAGAAPVQPKLLPVGFPLPDRALLVRRRDAQGRSLAPAAQAGLRGDRRVERGGVTSVGYRVKKEEIIPLLRLASQPVRCRAGKRSPHL